ncbi:unnamed protein product [Cochlearia groenlandica]
MADFDGGAEEQARLTQYGYKENSNLVINVGDRLCGYNEPSGEAETLRGRIDPKSFGDRVVKGRPQELYEKLDKSKKKKRPKTMSTKAAYEAMLSLIQQQLGGQRLSIVCGAADEILAVLKNESVKNPEKKMEIEKLLSPVSSQIFDQLVSIGRMITDYQEGGGDSGSGKASEYEEHGYDVGVNIGFEEYDEDGGESDLDVFQEEKDEEVEEGAEPNRIEGVKANGEDDARHTNTSLSVHEVDAYWLQRKLYHEYEQQIDPQECQVFAEELLKILAEGSDRDVENKLLAHLHYEKFSLVKFLIYNRLKVVWCTRLARARDQEERNRIEKEMMGLGPELAEILKELHAKRATAKEREEKHERKIKEEARVLKGDSGGDEDRGRRDLDGKNSENCGSTVQRQIVDLESLAFDQDGFVRENKKCASSFFFQNLWQRVC